MSTVQQSASARDLTLEQMRHALEFSPIPTCILQWNKIVYINPAGLTLLGDEEVTSSIERYILKFSHPEIREEARRKRLDTLQEQGDEVHFSRRTWVRREGKWTRQEGGTLVLHVKAWDIPLAGGNGSQITFTDITAQRNIEEVSEERAQHLRLAVDSAQVGVWDYDPVTEKLRWSRRCHEIFDVPWNGDIDYAAFLKLLHPEDRERMHRSIQESIAANASGEFGCDYRILCSDGNVRWIATKGHAFFSNRGGQRKATRIIGTVLDITELRQSDASLRQHEKLAVTGRLAASIAHEINNPLEAITNLLYLLNEGELQQEQRKYIELAQQELARVVDISTQALRFYRDPSAPATCNMPEIIDSALTIFNGRIAASQIQVEREDSMDVSVLGAREELRQMVANLVHNAMDAMPHGGKLMVRTQRSTNWRTRRKGIRLVIADTGHGMSRTTMRRIFEPFFTTRTAVGTGLGLWLCAGVVQKHGGTIKVKSRQQSGRSGTVFFIFLPLDRRK